MNWDPFIARLGFGGGYLTGRIHQAAHPWEWVKSKREAKR